MLVVFFVPKMIETVERLLPEYYRILRKIAGEKGFQYNGNLNARTTRL